MCRGVLNAKVVLKILPLHTLTSSSIHLGGYKYGLQYGTTIHPKEV